MTHTPDLNPNSRQVAPAAVELAARTARAALRRPTTVRALGGSGPTAAPISATSGRRQAAAAGEAGAWAERRAVCNGPILKKVSAAPICDMLEFQSRITDIVFGDSKTLHELRWMIVFLAYFETRHSSLLISFPTKLYL